MSKFNSTRGLIMIPEKAWNVGNSKTNIERLLNHYGRPTHIRLMTELNRDIHINIVEIYWGNTPVTKYIWRVQGFSWGYIGKGPRALAWLFAVVGVPIYEWNIDRIQRLDFDLQKTIEIVVPEKIDLDQELIKEFNDLVSQDKLFFNEDSYISINSYGNYLLERLRFMYSTIQLSKAPAGQTMITRRIHTLIMEIDRLRENYGFDFDVAEFESLVSPSEPKGTWIQVLNGGRSLAYLLDTNPCRYVCTSGAAVPFTGKGSMKTKKMTKKELLGDEDPISTEARAFMKEILG